MNSGRWLCAFACAFDIRCCELYYFIISTIEIQISKIIKIHFKIYVHLYLTLDTYISNAITNMRNLKQKILDTEIIFIKF